MAIRKRYLVDRKYQLRLILQIVILVVVATSVSAVATFILANKSKKNLLDLANAWPELDYAISPDSGHSSHEPGIAKELIAATNRIAASGSPVRT